MFRPIQMMAALLTAVALVLPMTAHAAPVNLAAGRPTAQSSVYQDQPGYGSARGVDGSKSDASMFHTNNDPLSWWEVDLGQRQAVDNVMIYNRVDCCAERIAGMQVWISQDGTTYQLVYQHDQAAFRVRSAAVGGLEARYVRIVMPRREYLHLQEVEIYQYGTWQPPSARASVLRSTSVNSIGGAARYAAGSGGAAVPGAATAATGSWRSAGTGDCPGRDVNGSSGPNPTPGLCTPQFAGYTAVCWNNNCTYKNLPTAQCTGGASPGHLYTCVPAASSGSAAPTSTPTPPPAASTGGWKSAGVGDCPGRDVNGSSGPNPTPALCTPQFAGYTAVCWNNNCTYKNLPTAQCTGGASPGHLYTCEPAGSAGAGTPTTAPVPTPAPTPAPTSSAGGWRNAGTGDCPGRDVNGSSGPNPSPALCTAQFAGFTAVCWGNNCTYKNLPTAQCTGGSSPGRMYTCEPGGSGSSTGSGTAPDPWANSPNVLHYRVENFVYGSPDIYQNPRNYHDFLVDFSRCAVREVNAEDQQGREQYRVLVCREKSRLTFTTVTTSPGGSTGSPVEYDWVFGDGGRTVSGAYRQGSTFGPSVGGLR